MTHNSASSQETSPIAIVYLIDFFGKGGGTENQLAVLVNNIDRRLFSPTIFTLRKMEDVEFANVSCPVHNLAVSSLLSVQSWRAFRQIVKFLRENRVGVLQLFFIDSNIFGILAGMIAGTRNIIISRRDMGWWYGQRRRMLTNLLNKRATQCIANAEAVKRAVVEHEGIQPDRIQVIYNGVSEDAVRATMDIRTTFGIPLESPIVCIVANLKPIKRVDRFLRVAASLSNRSAHFIVMGSGHLKAELLAQAESLGIGSRTHFFSTVDEVFAVMRQCSVGVLTSESEGLSNVLIEYALNGLPAVTFDVGGNSEVVTHGKTGFVVPAFDEAAMTKSIDLLLSDESLAKRMGREAQEDGRHRFSIPGMTRHHEQVYLRLVGRSNFVAADDRVVA
jgi:L-malate glycosyltransferase